MHHLVCTIRLATGACDPAERPCCIRTICSNIRDCSKATGFIQPVHDEVRQGFVDGLRLELHATYRAPDAHGSALASAPGRHSFASCDSAGCPAPRHWRLLGAACPPETSRLFPRWAQRAS